LYRYLKFKKDAQKNEWMVITSDINEKNKSINIKDFEINKDKNYIIVFSDEKGISESILKIANNNIIIPPMLDQNKINKFPYNITNKMSIGCECSIILNLFKSQSFK